MPCRLPRSWHPDRAAPAGRGPAAPGCSGRPATAGPLLLFQQYLIAALCPAVAWPGLSQGRGPASPCRPWPGRWERGAGVMDGSGNDRAAGPTTADPMWTASEYCRQRRTRPAVSGCRDRHRSAGADHCRRILPSWIRETSACVLPTPGRPRTARLGHPVRPIESQQSGRTRRRR